MREVMQTSSFALRVTQEEGVPFASHLPALAGRRAWARMERCWATWPKPTSMAAFLMDTQAGLFQGPARLHSPRGMRRTAVPTWNY
jgi:predicted FMN-binding regulatory protein PaiB